MDAKENIALGIVKVADSLIKDINFTLKKEFGISLAQYKVLAVLSDNGSGLDQSSIARICNQSEASISRQIVIMHKKGLVRVMISQTDKKTHKIIFSSDGLSLYKRVSHKISEKMSFRMRSFSTAETQALIRLLQKF